MNMGLEIWLRVVGLANKTMPHGRALFVILDIKSLRHMVAEPCFFLLLFDDASKAPLDALSPSNVDFDGADVWSFVNAGESIFTAFGLSNWRPWNVSR